MDWTKLFFSPDGRIGRQAYWIGWLVLFGANSLLGWTGIVPILAIYCWVCISAKRFHDMGKSGWLAAIPVTVGFVVPIVAMMVFGAGIVLAAINGENNDPAAAAAVMSGLGSALLLILVAGLVGLVFLIWQGVAQSDPNENRYGPPPAPTTF